jgi:hypothetical protein
MSICKGISGTRCCTAWEHPLVLRCSFHGCCADALSPLPVIVPLQDERGVSRDEMAAALLEVAEGRVPKDRLALKCLLEDMQVGGWCFLFVCVCVYVCVGGRAKTAVL